MEAQTLKPFANAHPPQRYAVSIAFVALIHAGLLYVLWNMGVIDAIIHPKPPDPFHVSIYEPPKPRVEPTKPPRPTPVDRRVYVPPPDDPADQETDQGQTIVATREPPPPQMPPTITSARGIMSTHTIPDYPPISRRLNETGTVTLHLVISDTGTITDVTVERSSGHERLDAAAVAWVKAHWRYQPAVQNGQPVASTADAQVKFELR